MDKFIKLSKDEKKNVIQKVAFDLGLRSDIVEKDIWVCYVLGKLFSIKELKGKLIFKGGTCLSKAYNLIGRFSEDVDITISKDCLDVAGTSKKPRVVESRIRHAAEDFVQNDIYELLSKIFAKDLEVNSWSLKVSEEDGSTLLFQFPNTSENYLLNESDDFFLLEKGGKLILENEHYNYIKPSIKLEFGALGDNWPCEEKTVEPYAKKILPNIFASSQVKVLDVKRNFLEKLLILHSICLRPIDKPLKHHYSRHYYDVFCLIKAGIGKDALELPDVLQSVIENKITFWNETWKPYDIIKSHSDIRVVPQDKSRLKELETDYERMKEMFFATYPTFAEIIEELRSFEESFSKIKKVR